MLYFLDIAFFVLHSVLILFNMVGWYWRRTRVLHLITLGVTAFSWFGLGPIASWGWGHCLCTDLHVQVRQQLGYHDEGTNDIQLLTYYLAGMSISEDAAYWSAGIVFAGIVLATAFVWLRDLWWERSRFAQAGVSENAGPRKEA